MSKAQTWRISIFFDLKNEDLAEIQELAGQIRALVPDIWAVWPTPAGYHAHPVPHIGLMAYFERSTDPLEPLVKVLSEVGHASETEKCCFAGNDIQLVSEHKVNWPPSIRGAL